MSNTSVFNAKFHLQMHKLAVTRSPAVLFLLNMNRMTVLPSKCHHKLYCICDSSVIMSNFHKTTSSRNSCIKNNHVKY